MKTRTILATWMMVGAMGASLQASTAEQPSAASPVELQQGSAEGVALVRVAANPFAGAYCGYLGRLFGSIAISDRGSVSGSFSYTTGGVFWYSENLSFSGRVTAEGVMRLKVVQSITVRDHGVRTSTERYSVTLNVTLDDSGSLVGTSGWGTPFVLSPCQ